MDLALTEDALHDFANRLANQESKYSASLAKICEKYEVLDRLSSDLELDPKIRNVLTREFNPTAHDWVPNQDLRNEGGNPSSSSSLIGRESLRPRRIVQNSANQLDDSVDILSSEDESDESCSGSHLGGLGSIEIRDISKMDDDADSDEENSMDCSAAVDADIGEASGDGDNSVVDGKTYGGRNRTLTNEANLSAIDLSRIDKTCMKFAQILHSQSLIVSDHDERIRRAKQDGKKAAMDHVDRLKARFQNHQAVSTTTARAGSRSVASLPGCALKDVTNYVCAQEANPTSTLIDVDVLQLHPIEEYFAYRSGNSTPALKKNIPNCSSDGSANLQPTDKSSDSVSSRQILFERSNFRHWEKSKTSPCPDKSPTRCLQSSAVAATGSNIRPSENGIVRSCRLSDDDVSLDKKGGSAKSISSDHYSADKLQPNESGVCLAVPHSSSDNMFRERLPNRAKSGSIGHLERLDRGTNLSSLHEVNRRFLSISSCVQPTLSDGIRGELGNVIVGSAKVSSRGANCCDGSDFVFNGSSMKSLDSGKPHNTTYSIVNCPPTLSKPHFPVRSDEINGERTWQFDENSVDSFGGQTFNIDSLVERNSADIVEKCPRFSSVDRTSRSVGSIPPAESVDGSGSLSVLRGDTTLPEHRPERPAELDRCLRHNSVASTTGGYLLQNIDCIIDFICAAGVPEEKSMAELDAEAIAVWRRAVSIDRGQSVNTYTRAVDGCDNSLKYDDCSGRHFAMQDSGNRIGNDQTYDRRVFESCDCVCNSCSTERFHNATVGGSRCGSMVSSTSSSNEGSGKSQSSGLGHLALGSLVSNSYVYSDRPGRDQLHCTTSWPASDDSFSADSPSTVQPTPGGSSLAIPGAHYDDSGGGRQRERSVLDSYRNTDESIPSLEMHSASPSRSINKQCHAVDDGGTFNVSSASGALPIHDHCFPSKQLEVGGACNGLPMLNATYGITLTRPCTPTLDITKPVIQLTDISKQLLQRNRLDEPKDEIRKQSKHGKSSRHDNNWNGKNNIISNPKIKFLSKDGLKSDELGSPRRFNSPRRAKDKACRIIKLTIDAGY